MDESFVPEALALIRNNGGRVYIACMGEGGYPNVSVREVVIDDANALIYRDREDSRTVQLMKNSPQVLVSVLHEDQPYHGYKLKGTAAFESNPATDGTVLIRVQIEQVFPY
jgi:hypothetical protein